MIPTFQPEYLAFLIPVALSLFLEKGPPVVRAWWKGIVDRELKPTVLFVGAILVVLLVRGLACVNIDVGLGAECPNPSDPQMWVNTIGIGIAVWLTMEMTHKITAPSDALKLTVEKMSGDVNVSAAPAAPLPPAVPTPLPTLNMADMPTQQLHYLVEAAHREIERRKPPGDPEINVRAG